MEPLSGVMIIIIIFAGVLTFVIFVIFAKRQIMRFSLRSRRGPHVPVGNDAKKTLRREIERRLDCINKIAQEPKLIFNDDKYILHSDQQLPPYHYRMLAIDDIKILEREIARGDGQLTRHPYDSLRAFLLTTLSTCVNSSSGQRMIHQFCDMYEYARHDPNEFGREEYETYHRLLLKLLEAAKLLSRKSSPARTKSYKTPSLLDPSRLKPPPPSSTTPGLISSKATNELAAGHHSKVNLTLGLQGRDIDDSEGVVTNRSKTDKIEQEDVDDEYGANDGGDDEIVSISSVKFNSSSIV